MDKRTLAVFLLLLIVISILGAVSLESQLPPLIRLHVLANSNSAEDQELKYMVRDKVIELMTDKFRNSRSLEESRQILLNNMDVLEEAAFACLQEAGADYPVRALYGQFQFPTRYYGSFFLPAGRYEAVRIVIGQGQGANWWCVLFPPLCFVEGKTVPDPGGADTVRKIAESLPQGTSIKIKPALKVVEIWQEITNKAAAAK